MRTVLPLILLVAGCASTSLPVPKEWAAVPRALEIRTVSVDSEGRVEHSPRVAPLRTEDGSIRIEGNRLMNGSTPLTEVLAGIDSFDFLESREEVIFSAKKDASFDIGVVASDGSVLNWLPADPADEVSVEWAPRGNKVSYFVRAPVGDLVRTFHIPTSFSFVVDFGPASLHALAWDPPAERFAVAYSTIDASDRVELLRYDGTERKMVVPPAERISADVVAFAPDAFALRPLDLLYGERLPVVVWVANRFAWEDARGALMASVRHVSVVTTRLPGESLWKAIRETPWVDASRLVVVQPAGVYPAGTDAAGPGVSPEALFISGDPSIPPGRYRREANVLRVAPAAIQSFSAGFIADQWKRTGPTYGSSR